MNAVVPGFAHDVFVSYSHIDDRAVGKPGWVTSFATRLRNQLSVELGRDASVWFDVRLNPGDLLTREIQDRLRKTAVLIAVMSRSYVQSGWCGRELKAFLDATNKGELAVDNRSRVIKVIKQPLEDDPHHEHVLADAKGVEFYHVGTDGLPRELAADTDEYDYALTRVAHSIARILESMRKRRTVFVGPASAANQTQREKVRQELLAYDYDVVDAGGAAAPLDADLRAAVEKSSLCLHFVDSTDSPAQTESTNRARRAADAAGTRQVVVVRSDEEAVPPVFETLSAAAPAEATEVLVNRPTHELKTTVHRLLDAPADTAAGPHMPRVYLVCHQDDHPLIRDNRARALRDYLAAHQIEVKVPLAEQADGAEFSRDNRTKLKSCDAVVLYWGTSRQAWFEQRLDELLQARGWRRGKPFTVKVGYVADPDSPIKQNFVTHDVDLLIKQFTTLDPSAADFQSFLAKFSPPAA
jgi:CMP-2-keto-3-deoxyoctulosonic acid synthetase